MAASTIPHGTPGNEPLQLVDREQERIASANPGRSQQPTAHGRADARGGAVAQVFGGFGCGEVRAGHELVLSPEGRALGSSDLSQTTRIGHSDSDRKDTRVSGPAPVPDAPARSLMPGSHTPTERTARNSHEDIFRVFLRGKLFRRVSGGGRCIRGPGTCSHLGQKHGQTLPTEQHDFIGVFPRPHVTPQFWPQKAQQPTTSPPLETDRLFRNSHIGY